MIRKSLNLKDIAFTAGVILVVLGLLTFYIWYQTESIRLGYQIGEIEAQNAALREEIRKLETRKAQLLSLETIDRIAREKLGLSDPRRDQVIYEDPPHGTGVENP